MKVYREYPLEISDIGKKVLVVDIGSWTIDSMMILDKRPDSTKCDTQNEGLIRCMRSINRLAVQVKNHKIDEADNEWEYSFEKKKS